MRPAGVDDKKNGILFRRQKRSKAAQYPGADIIAPHVEDFPQVVPGQHGGNRRGQSRHVGQRHVTGRAHHIHPAGGQFRFHAAHAVIRVNHVQVNQRDRNLFRQHQGGVDRQFGLAASQGTHKNVDPLVRVKTSAHKSNHSLSFGEFLLITAQSIHKIQNPVARD